MARAYKYRKPLSEDELIELKICFDNKEHPNDVAIKFNCHVRTIQEHYSRFNNSINSLSRGKYKPEVEKIKEFSTPSLPKLKFMGEV